MKKATTQAMNDSSFSNQRRNCSNNQSRYTQQIKPFNSNVTAANDFGLVVDHIEQDGQLHRVPTQVKPSAKNGWYVAHDNILIMGDWITGNVETFKADGRKITRGDKEKISRIIEQKKLEKRKLQDQTAELARAQYVKAENAAYHPYLIAKGIDPVDGLKMVNNQLLVPLYDIKTGLIRNLQRIYPDGTKRFLKNGQITGLCCPCGLLNLQVGMPESVTNLYICEGFATAACIYQMTGQPVLAALNAGNLLAVSKLVKSKWPNTSIVIAADDDWLTAQKYGVNPGKEKAIEAANAIGASISIPPFSPEQHMNGLSDWNDYWLDCTKRAA